MPHKNVIFFGSTGCGKSSVVNMILGKEKASISSGAKGCTFSTTEYKTRIDEVDYSLYDTAGLDEGKEGTIVSDKALRNLCNLVRLLSKDGVNLLVFVFRVPMRITEAVENNYRIFYEGFCAKGVPIVIVITGLENEQPMSDWWLGNKAEFNNRGLKFEASACITATRGRKDKDGGYINEDEYNFSRELVKDLIRSKCSEEGWKKPRQKWVVRCWRWIRNTFTPIVGAVLGWVVEFRNIKRVVAEILGDDEGGDV